jgi:thiosulfate/3-mercaptopyruvate sulfurtransferase
MYPLISVGELQARLGQENLVIVDCRHDLADVTAGRKAYEQGHTPGAVFLHLDEDLSGPKTGENGRHPLPDPLTLARRLSNVGIGDGCHVVAYDSSSGTYAARLWWLMRWLGHDHVQVLNGGLPMWTKAGNDLSTSIPKPAPIPLTPHLRRGWTVDADMVLENIDAKQFLVVDARAPGRFAGEGETIDPVAGHIPNAVNRFFQLNLQQDGSFKPANTLRAEWMALLGSTDVRDSVQQCGSGVTACHNLLALEAAGLHGARLYPGSWSEWCSDRGRPVATGSV